MHERNEFLIEQSEIAMGSNERVDLEALRISRLCPWGYSFETHRKSVLYVAHFYTKNMIWC